MSDRSASADTTAVKINLLGTLRVECGGEVLTHFRSRKAAQVLAFVALRAPRPVSRETLIEQVWPEDGVDSARASLNTALWSLRQDLRKCGDAADAVLISDRFSVTLAAGRCVCDHAVFEARLRQARGAGNPAERLAALSTAAALYEGELLSGLEEPWLLPARTHLSVLYEECLRDLGAEYEAAGELTNAREIALRSLAANPLSEDACGGAVRLLAATGQLSAAQQMFRDYERRLKDELGTAASDTLRRAVRELRQAPTPSSPSGSVVGTDRRSETAPAPLPGPAAIDEGNAPPPAGGALQPQSAYYLTRPADAQFDAAVMRGDSIVLVKGPRQVGKTSLLARGADDSRRRDQAVAFFDFQLAGEETLDTLDSLLRALARSLFEQLDLDGSPTDHWFPEDGPTINFRRWMRRAALGQLSKRLVWVLDEVDLLFSRPYSSEFFGLIRAWHNERALDPGGPWRSLTVAMGYATEAFLFIRDTNQSPFNVGTRLALDDFTLAEVEELNRRHGLPLASSAEIGRFFQLLGGQPFLTQGGLGALRSGLAGLSELESGADCDVGLFAEHLRRLLTIVSTDEELVAAVRRLLAGPGELPLETFYRLGSAGIVAGNSSSHSALRCELYGRYFKRHLAGSVPESSLSEP